MDISRRELLILPAAAALANAVSPARSSDTDTMQDVPWSRKMRRVGQLNMTEHDPAVLDVEAVGRLLGQPEGRRRDGERHRHPGVLPDQGAVPQEGKVSSATAISSATAARREEARHARDRAHESGPQLGRRRAGASGVVPARRAGRSGPPHRRPASLPHLHVHHLHDRLHAGDHEGNQLALRRGRPVHQRMAAAGIPAGLSLRAVPDAAARRGRLRTGSKFNERDDVTSGSCTTPSRKRRSRRTSSSPTWAAAFDRRPNLVELGKGLRVVPVRQPGPRRRRHADLGMRAAGSRLQRRADGQDGHQRHRRVVHRRSPLAQRLQVARGGADVDERDAGLRHGAVPPHHRRRERHGRRSPLARARAAVLQLDGEARAALRQQAFDREHRRRDGTADAPLSTLRRAGP